MNEQDKLSEALLKSAEAQLAAAQAMMELAKATQNNADATNRLMDQVIEDSGEDEEDEEQPLTYLNGRPR